MMEEPIKMTADDLKVTILRAAKPGDVVFFNVSSDDPEHRDLIEALGKFLSPIKAVMLPPSIQLVGSIFEKGTPETDPELVRLREENQALRNLAENLRPGPISEALGGVEHERPYREVVSNERKPPAEMFAALERAQERLGGMGWPISAVAIREAVEWLQDGTWELSDDSNNARQSR
jgi:hypothetical protein